MRSLRQSSLSSPDTGDKKRNTAQMSGVSFLSTVSGLDGRLWRRLRTVYGVGAGRLRHRECAHSDGAGALEISDSRFFQNFVIH